MKEHLAALLRQFANQLDPPETVRSFAAKPTLTVFPATTTTSSSMPTRPPDGREGKHHGAN